MRSRELGTVEVGKWTHGGYGIQASHCGEQFRGYGQTAMVGPLLSNLAAPQAKLGGAAADASLRDIIDPLKDGFSGLEEQNKGRVTMTRCGVVQADAERWSIPGTAVRGPPMMKMARKAWPAAAF